MKFFKLAVTYLKKHWILPLFALGLGALLSIARLGGGFYAYLSKFFEQGKPTFYDVYSQLSPIVGSWWGVLIALILCAMFFAYYVGIIDRHMKIGEFRLNAPFRKVNENVTFMLVFLVVFILVEEIVNVLVALASAAILSVATPVVGYVVTIIAYVLFQGVTLLLFTMCALWIPETVITGMSMKDSLSVAIGMSKGHVGKMFFGALIGLSSAFLISMIGAFTGPVIRTILNAVSAGVLIGFVPVYVFTSYYEISDLEREDLSPVKNFWKK